MTKHFGWLLIFCLWSGVGYAQLNNPYSLKWRQIKADQFRILYPVGYEVQAQRMANTIASIKDPATKTMGGRVRPVTILLQNQTSVSNGFVTLAPWRSEFFGMPPQDYNFIGTNDWLNLLAVHEYRHIVQFSRSKTGFNRWIYTLFGDQGLAVTAFVAVPQWFWEGDAVAIETAFTPTGRGRIPYFNLLFRTNLQEGRVFNYNKQYLRSYKHNISDHYVLGYNMVSYLRKRTGQPDIWERIAGEAWSKPFIPFTFSRAIKKETGMYVRDLYREMANELRAQWKAEVDTLQLTSFEKINARTSSAYTDYLYPQVQPDGSVLVWKRGIGDIEQLVLLNAGQEKLVKTGGPVSLGGQLSAEGGRIVWNEFRYDPRWQMKNYLVIRSYDLKTGKTQQLTRQTRYAGAALSPDGARVATIETGTDYTSRVVVLDWQSGEVVHTFANSEGAALSMPRWIDNDRLVALRTFADGKTVSEFNLVANTVTDWLPRTHENLGYPVPAGDYLLFNSPRSGIDNIYAWHTSTHEWFQITNSRYGALNPDVSPDGKFIYYNDQSRDGLDVVRVPFRPEGWKQVEPSPTSRKDVNEVLAQQEGHPDLLSNVGNQTYHTKKYPRWKGMFNVHSWGPYTSSSLNAINVGIASRDLLNTTTIDAGYRYDLTERTGAWSVTASYQGFYPIIDLTFSQGTRQATNGFNVNDEVRTATFNWKEQTIKPTLRLPLLLTRSHFNTELVVKNGIGITRVSDFTNDVDGKGREITLMGESATFYNLLDNGLLLTNDFELTFSHLMRRSRRDFQSKWGQRLEVKATGALRGSDFSASSTAATGYLFFPGLFKHHSFFTIGAFQHVKINFYPDNYLLRNQIPKPRGGFSFPFAENFAFGSANYALPLWYPDLALGPVLNLQRVRANFFYDYGLAETDVANTVRTFYRRSVYQSAGVELRFDGNIMRLLGQFDVGVRASYQITGQTPFVELLIGGFGF